MSNPCSSCGQRIAMYCAKCNHKLQARVTELEEAFGHTHVDKMNGTDACKRCGLDLRDDIHSKREGE